MKSSSNAWRWFVCGLLFLATLMNYLDRQTLSIATPLIREDMGVAVGDYDNDGLVDIYISTLGPDHLFRNLGNGKFSDVTRAARLGDPGFGASCAWVDYDKDGDLDLFVCNYVQWTQETDIFCSLDGVNKSYCTPESYKGVSSRLYQNQGNGTFSDVTQKAGLFDPTSKALGVAVFDENNDGWPDLVVANDTQPNKLYINNKNGTFTERGVPSGIAFSEDGTVRGAMSSTLYLEWQPLSVCDGFPGRLRHRLP